MSVEVHIVDGALGPYEPGESTFGVGAVIVFEGVVRPAEDGVPIEALDYEAYEPMASRQIGAIAHELASEFGLFAMHVWHSTGRVPAGRCSFRLVVESAHRKEGLAACDAFIDRFKKDVPIWKKPVHRGDADSAE